MASASEIPEANIFFACVNETVSRPHYTLRCGRVAVRCMQGSARDSRIADYTRGIRGFWLYVSEPSGGHGLLARSTPVHGKTNDYSEYRAANQLELEQSFVFDVRWGNHGDDNRKQSDTARQEAGNPGAGFAAGD